MGWPSRALAAGLLLAAAGGRVAAEPRYGLGHAAALGEVAGWDIDVRPDGAGLPPGRGSVAAGAQLFAATCAACHGAHGEGALATALAGGQGSLASKAPVQTVGSYWPYATTLFDYIRRAMPLPAPQSLAPDEVYALTAYVLSLNGIVPPDAALDAASLPMVQMPNRDGFRRAPGAPP